MEVNSKQIFEGNDSLGRWSQGPLVGNVKVKQKGQKPVECVSERVISVGNWGSVLLGTRKLEYVYANSYSSLVGAPLRVITP